MGETAAAVGIVAGGLAKIAGDLLLLSQTIEQHSAIEAIDQLTLAIESVVENYREYRDYNSTTTQSDRGEMLFTLLDFLRRETRLPVWLAGPGGR